MKVVAVSDSKGCIYNPKGLDFEKLSKIKTKTGSVINYRPGKELVNTDIFELDVDILVPAALPDVITIENVKQFLLKAGFQKVQHDVWDKGEVIIQAFR